MPCRGIIQCGYWSPKKFMKLQHFIWTVLLLKMDKFITLFNANYNFYIKEACVLLYRQNKKYQKLIKSAVISLYQIIKQWPRLYNVSPFLERLKLNEFVSLRLMVSLI